MVSVLVLVNEISPTSIPFETALEIATQEYCEITVAAFYNTAGEQATEGDVPVEIQPLGADSRFDPVAWRRFYRELQTGGYDVLHTHHNFTGSVGRMIASRSNVSVVNTEHCQHSSYTTIQNIANAPTLPLANKIVFNSEATQSSLTWYERLLLGEEKQSVIYNGVDLARLDNSIKTTEETSGDPAVLSVGRLVSIKNYETLLEAFAVVRERIPDATLLLIGDGPLRQELETKAAVLGIADAVHFRGKIGRDEVYQELARADLFTIPSHAEGFCVAAVEAMAAGLPVVVSDTDVFHEVVGDPGVFADPDDSDAFADAISRLLQQPEKRERLGEEAKNRARSTFSLEQTAREYSNLYKKVAETSNR
jgi:glycosyltransferase involved in cell wall biosynthesis